MSTQIKEWLDLLNDFLKEGTQFINRCTKPNKQGKKNQYLNQIPQILLLKPLFFIFYFMASYRLGFLM